MLDEPVYVDITNVARWWMLETFDMTDMRPHTVMPPWQRFVMEYDMPARWLTADGYATTGAPSGARVRFDAAAIDTELYISYFNDPLTTDDMDCLLLGKLFLGAGDEIGVEVPVSSAGQASMMALRPIGVDFDLNQMDDLEIGYLQNILRPIWFAISLIHCKNVELVDKPIKRHERRRAARKGLPLIQYKTLVIEPFKKQVRNEAAASGENEIHRALHICRGHFATYTEDKPLFGKYTGTYWRPMHVRGRADAGVVHKDYKVVVDEGE